MKIMNKTKFALLCATLLTLCSCNKWLDIKPKEFVDEEDLFSRETGFKEALTGVYQLAAKPDLYGEKLTFDFLDKLAQRYFYTNPTPGQGQSARPFQDSSYYNFKSEASEKRINPIWKNAYSTIANINNLLHWTERNKHVLATPGYYEIIRGEALAFRSYLYFDLLRMFGPVYKNDPTARSIVYRTELDREFSDLLPANVALDYIIADLHTAMELLKDADPLNFSLTGPTLDEDQFLGFRFKRMNYMATKALLARIYLYKGDFAKARTYALEVIESGHFTLVTDNFGDPILSTEIILALHIDKMQENITNKIATHNTSEWLIDGTATFNAMFNIGGGDANDFRAREGAGFDIVDSRLYITRKFQRPLGLLVTAMEGTMPLIRLAEMYYIMSETEPSLAEATQWINQIRSARAVLPLPVFASEAEKMHHIELEYRKEFYGEGQLWYFYKRIGADANLFFNMANILPNWADHNYIFPIPQDEFQFGGVTKP
jgi:hypothetical protein